MENGQKEGLWRVDSLVPVKRSNGTEGEQLWRWKTRRVVVKRNGSVKMFGRNRKKKETENGAKLARNTSKTKTPRTG